MMVPEAAPARIAAAVENTLTRIAAINPQVNAFTDITGARARKRAAELDARLAEGAAAGQLFGMPFAVKNLFDVAGLPTRAGSKINRTHAPATQDAFLVRQLEAAGAICVGALNMGEYAYDFTGENIHDGPSRNPHDLSRMSGGSSGGSGAAVAAGLVPVALGSDTNGSIRVPSALCGLFGLKPTYGRLSRGGTFPFVASLDHLGPLARNCTDLALVYDAMQGADADDPAQTPRPHEPVFHAMTEGLEGLRIARLGGYFDSLQTDAARSAVTRIADALGAVETREWPEVARARAAAYLISTVEGASLHLDRLRAQADAFDPAVRDRLIAGAMIPGSWVIRAQKFRRWFRDQVRLAFAETDIFIAPATPCVAPLLGQQTMKLDGVDLPVRANMGIFTQPVSFIGLPVCSVPVWIEGSDLPLGVQIIGAPWREDRVMRVAHALETMGAALFRAPRNGNFAR